MSWPATLAAGRCTVPHLIKLGASLGSVQGDLQQLAISDMLSNYINDVTPPELDGGTVDALANQEELLPYILLLLAH